MNSFQNRLHIFAKVYVISFDLYPSAFAFTQVDMNKLIAVISPLNLFIYLFI